MNQSLVYIFTGEGKGPTEFFERQLTADLAVFAFGKLVGQNSWYINLRLELCE